MQDTKSGRVKLKLQWLDNPLSQPSSPEKAAGQSPSLESHSSGFSPELVTTSQYSAPPPSQGTLRLTLHGANDLPKPMFGGVNAYVKATLQNTEQVYRSPVKGHDRSPVWEDSEFLFESVYSNDMLKVRVADKQAIGKTVIGYVIVPVQEVAKHDGEAVRKTWPISSDSGEVVGSVDMSLHFTQQSQS